MALICLRHPCVFVWPSWQKLSCYVTFHCLKSLEISTHMTTKWCQENHEAADYRKCRGCLLRCFWKVGPVTWYMSVASLGQPGRVGLSSLRSRVCSSVAMEKVLQTVTSILVATIFSALCVRDSWQMLALTLMYHR